MFSNRLGSISNLVSISLVALLASSCSMKPDTTTLSIPIPASVPNPVMINAHAKGGAIPISGMAMSAGDVSAMSIPVHFAAVSITGPSMGEISKNWFQEAGAINPIVTVEGVPRGSGRLVQVIAGADNGGGTTIYYGEAVFDANADVASVSVNMTALSNAVQGEADIEGRYFGPGGTTPSGRVKVMYKPSNANPPMTIFKVEMFAGWFRMMAPAFGDFRYVLEETGEVLFASATNPTGAISASTSGYQATLQNANLARNALIQVPAATRPNYRTSDPNDREP